MANDQFMAQIKSHYAKMLYLSDACRNPSDTLIGCNAMQTGSGKTHTLIGEPGSLTERGIIPRAAAEVFDCIAAQTCSEYAFQVRHRSSGGIRKSGLNPSLWA